MDEVEIYISQSLEGPRTGYGFYIYLLQKEGSNKTLTDTGDGDNYTAHSLEVMALIDALRRFKRPCKLKVHSAHGWLKQIWVNGWLEKWQSADWKNTKGKEVANADLLRELSAILAEKEHEILEMDCDLKDYTKWMEFQIEKQRRKL